MNTLDIIVMLITILAGAIVLSHVVSTRKLKKKIDAAPKEPDIIDCLEASRKKHDKPINPDYRQG